MSNMKNNEHYIYKWPVTTGWLQTIRFINFFKHERKVSNLSLISVFPYSLALICLLVKLGVVFEQENCII